MSAPQDQPARTADDAKSRTVSPSSPAHTHMMPTNLNYANVQLTLTALIVLRAVEPTTKTHMLVGFCSRR